jgi:isoquinoline 1-oxidoreductase beta subunit
MALSDRKNDIAVLREGDYAARAATARRKIAAVYEMPFLAHATMEPPNALIEVRPDGASLTASLQSPGDASQTIARITGLPRQSIAISLTRSGGGFGRRLRNDFIAEAAMIAKRVPGPVKLLWDRTDDLGHDFYRPFGLHAMEAALDAKGDIVGWSHRCAATPRNYRDAGMADEPLWIGCLEPDDFPAHLIGDLEKSFQPLPCGLARGWWRGPIHTFHAFAVESFIDEIAQATGQDAVALRLSLYARKEAIPVPYPEDKPFRPARLGRVLEICAEKLGWHGNRRGLGIACHFTFGGYAAHGVEVAFEPDLVIKRVICVADVGRPINPLGLEAQLMGATIDGLSTALNLAITLENGQIQQKGFADYPLMTLAQAPKHFEIVMVPSEEPPSGAGEIGIPSIAPALANAIAAAGGPRVRRLPILKELKTLAPRGL